MPQWDYGYELPTDQSVDRRVKNGRNVYQAMVDGITGQISRTQAAGQGAYGAITDGMLTSIGSAVEKASQTTSGVTDSISQQLTSTNASIDERLNSYLAQLRPSPPSYGPGGPSNVSQLSTQSIPQSTGVYAPGDTSAANLPDAGRTAAHSGTLPLRPPSRPPPGKNPPRPIRPPHSHAGPSPCPTIFYFDDQVHAGGDLSGYSWYECGLFGPLSQIGSGAPRLGTQWLYVPDSHPNLWLDSGQRGCWQVINGPDGNVYYQSPHYNAPFVPFSLSWFGQALPMSGPTTLSVPLATQSLMWWAYCVPGTPIKSKQAYQSPGADWIGPFFDQGTAISQCRMSTGPRVFPPQIPPTVTPPTPVLQSPPPPQQLPPIIPSASSDPWWVIHQSNPVQLGCFYVIQAPPTPQYAVGGPYNTANDALNDPVFAGSPWCGTSVIPAQPPAPPSSPPSQPPVLPAPSTCCITDAGLLAAATVLANAIIKAWSGNTGGKDTADPFLDVVRDDLDDEQKPIVDMGGPVMGAIFAATTPQELGDQLDAIQDWPEQG